MTRSTNARIAGAILLAYIAAGIGSMVLFGQAARGETIAARLAGIARHSTTMGIVVVLGFVQALCALILAVTLYALTRDEDRDLAMLGLACRVGEGVVGACLPLVPALLWVATARGTNAPDASSAQAIGALLLQIGGWNALVSATFFAVGSAAFSWLLLRGRIIPVPLAWIGVVASVMLVVGLPLEQAGFLRGVVTSLIWLPMLVFEVPFALWLLVKGAAMPLPREAP